MKWIADKYIPLFIEKLGFCINPILLRLRAEEKQLLIFYFHGLYATNQEKERGHVDPQNNLTLQQFKDFVEFFLEYNYRFITPEDLLQPIDGRQPLIMATFDDGYFNNSLAVDVLKSFEVPATFFITTMNVAENQSYWWDIIFKYRMKEGVSLQQIRVEQEGLKRYKADYIAKYIRQNFGTEALAPWSDIDRPLSPNELREFSKNPWVYIGNHTENHAILTNCNRQEIRDELVNCNRKLLEITGKEPISIAYPNGNYNDLVLEVSKEVGLRMVMTTVSKLNPVNSTLPDFVKFDRFMAEPRDIRAYGNFCRLGYMPDDVYSGWKDRLKALKPS